MLNVCIENKKLVTYNVEHSRTCVLFPQDGLFCGFKQRPIPDDAAPTDGDSHEKNNEPRKGRWAALENKAEVGGAEIEEQVNDQEQRECGRKDRSKDGPAPVVVALVNDSIQTLCAEAVDLLQPRHITGGNGVIQFQLVYALLGGSGVGVPIRRDGKRLIGGDAKRLHDGDGVI